MEASDFNDCCNFIINKSPKSNCDFTDLKQILAILKNILDDYIIELSVKGIHKDDWPDDEELAEIETFYNMIKFEIYNKKIK